MTNIGSPSSNPGFENFATHPGFSNTNAHPGFGSMGGGPNAQTVGAMTGYFGGGYTGDSYSILPQTQSGQYYSNAGYNYGSQGMSYSPNAPVQYGSQQGYGQNMGYLNFGGNFSNYSNGYQNYVQPQTPFFPSYQSGQSQAQYGSAPAPYQQSYQPVMSHYGFGAPQQYNPAATLYGHQSGSVQMNYGQPSNIPQHCNHGGPQGGQPVVHHHHHFHLHDHDCQPAETNPPVVDTPDTDCEHTATQTPVAETPTYGGGSEMPVCEEPPVEVACDPEPSTQPPVTNNYGHHHHHHHHHNHGNMGTTPVVETPVVDADSTVATADIEPAKSPSRIVRDNPVAATQTAWGRVPHVNNEVEFGPASRQVADRITGGDSSAYHFGGRNPATNSDGMGPERNSIWHVFQQNESLRLDLKSGNFYETKADGTQVNRFHMSAVANLERQAGGDYGMGYKMVGDFLAQRDLAVPGTSRFTPPASSSPSSNSGSTASAVSAPLTRTEPTVSNATMTTNTASTGQAADFQLSGNRRTSGGLFG